MINNAVIMKRYQFLFIFSKPDLSTCILLKYLQLSASSNIKKPEQQEYEQVKTNNTQIEKENKLDKANGIKIQKNVDEDNSLIEENNKSGETLVDNDKVANQSNVETFTPTMEENDNKSNAGNVMRWIVLPIGLLIVDVWLFFTFSHFNNFHAWAPVLEIIMAVVFLFWAIFGIMSWNNTCPECKAWDALEEIDADIEQCLCKESKDRDRKNQDIKDSDKNKKFKKKFANLPADSLAEMSIYEAMRKKAEMVEIEKAEGRISAGYVYVYPPEIPLIVPGEVITGNVIDSLVCCYKMGLNIKGMENESIRVIIS